MEDEEEKSKSKGKDKRKVFGDLKTKFKRCVLFKTECTKLLYPEKIEKKSLGIISLQKKSGGTFKQHLRSNRFVSDFWGR